MLAIVFAYHITVEVCFFGKGCATPSHIERGVDYSLGVASFIVMAEF